MLRLCAMAMFATMIGSPAWSTVRIDVGYDIIANEIQPEVKPLTSRGGSTIILNNDGTVTKSMNNGLSTNSLNGYVSSITRSGVTSVSHYKITKGSITEFFENDQARETITVNTNGENYCTARAQFHPARGQRYIIWNAANRSYVSSEQAINVTCRIQKLN